MAEPADYGIDAPGVIRNLALVGIALLIVVAVTPPSVKLGPIIFLFHPMFVGTAILCIVEAVLMVLYAKRGKFIHRDKMMEMVDWRGDEKVLDVGTGRGLLLVAAARRLTNGRAVGIDIWNTADLSGNSLERSQKNLVLEGVSAKCELRSEDASKMSFADDEFDVVVSNLCLHNIYDKAARQQACREIVRVLKPGGVALISDYKLTGEYAKLFRSVGLEVQRTGLKAFTTFPPLRIVTGRKAAKAGARMSVALTGAAHNAASTL
ncbi:MAG: class I SAM-dependent methyltransferase [Acidobacteriaceae bacterium]